jgi:N-acetylneuraminic acid mutarotase
MGARTWRLKEHIMYRVRKPAVALLLVCMTVLVVVACASDQNGVSAAASAGAWTELRGSGDLPSGSSLFQMVYDPDSRTVILCGAGRRTLFTSTWSYDLARGTWTDLGDSAYGPPARTAGSLSYDINSKRAILFGGGTAFAAGLNDMWAYDPAKNLWTELHPAGDLPSARGAHSMVYEERSGKIMLFGGQLAEGAEDDGLPFHLANDTWTYDAAANEWTELRPNEGVPAPRSSQAMVYDTRSGKVIMFGGLTNEGVANDTWAYDPAANVWAELNPTGDLPLPRSNHAMVYDTRSGKVIMFGGYTDEGEVNDTWVYDPAANVWAELHPPGDLPLPRSNHAMICDPVAGIAILFGGIGSSGMAQFFDMWAYGFPQ